MKKSRRKSTSSPFVRVQRQPLFTQSWLLVTGITKRFVKRFVTAKAVAANVGGFILVLLLGAAVQAQTSAPVDAPAPPERPSAMLGASIYQQNCAPCHGANGNPADVTALTTGARPQPLTTSAALWEMAPAAAFQLTKFGGQSDAKPALHGYLNDRQIWQALFYAWSLHTNVAELADGAALYRAECAACHGESGRGDGPRAENLMVDFTDLRAMNQRSLASLDEGWRIAHAEIGAELDEAERVAVLEAIRAFTYLPPWESPYVPGEGAITGRIVQGSAGASIPADQEVTLMVYMSFIPVSAFTTTVDAAGNFAFTQAATSPDVVYYVGTTYEDVAYGSDLFALSVTTPTVELVIPIYETTSDASGLRFSRAQAVIDHQPGALRVRQLLLVANDGDRTVVGEPIGGGDRTVTVPLPIPAAATEVEFQGGALGARYIQVGDTLYDTTPIRPGAQSRQIVLAYTLPYADTRADIAAAFAYPVESLSMLVADLPELAVEVSEPLEFVGNQTVQNVAYRVWSGALPEPGRLALTLQNLIPAGSVDPRRVQTPAPPVAAQPAGADALVSEVPPIFAGIAVAALVLVIGGGILYGKYSRDKVKTLYALRKEKERLLSAIAALDDRHDLGEIDDEVWSAERVALMNSLRNVNDSLDRMPQSGKYG